jgi:hypothetical protein
MNRMLGEGDFRAPGVIFAAHASAPVGSQG